MIPFSVKVPLPDLIALIFFFSIWGAYSYYSDHAKNSLIGKISLYTLQWMTFMTQRENRITDASLLGTLQQSASFIASTTIFILAGFLAVLGSEDTVLQIIKKIPYAVKTTSFLFEIKIFTLSCIFAYAFFKQTWAIRHFNYMAILMGATPPPNSLESHTPNHCQRLARMCTIATNHFSRGLRAYYYGLAALSWFLSPFLFMALTLWTTLILLRRDFYSSLVRSLDARFNSSSVI